MEIHESKEYCIFTPLSSKLDKRESDRLFNEVLKETRSVGFDLSYVSDCTYEFIDMIKNLSKLKSPAVFNIQPDIFALFNFNNLDKYALIYVSEQDFMSGKRNLVNRRFSVV